MAYNPMDMNNDGRVTYADYELHQRYINPSSPSYQGRPPSQITNKNTSISSGNFGRNLLLTIIFFASMYLIKLMGISYPLLLLCVFLPQFGIFYLILIIREKKIDESEENLDTLQKLIKAKRRTIIQFILLLACSAFLICSVVYENKAKQIADSSDYRVSYEQVYQAKTISEAFLWGFWIVTPDCLVSFINKRNRQKRIEKEIRNANSEDITENEVL